MNLWIITNLRLGAGNPLPANAIQNLRCAMALAEAGHRVLVWVDRAERGATGQLEAWLGRAMPAGMALIAARGRGARGEKRTPFATPASRIWNIARGRLRGGQPDVILSRSPRALAQLGMTPRWLLNWPRAPRLVLEYQYPEWALLWRGWRRRQPQAGLRECVARLKALRAKEERWLAVADGVLYAARAHEGLLDRAGWRGPARLLASACPTAESEPAAGPFEFAIGYVGSLAPENGIETLLEALRAMPDEKRLLIVVRSTPEERARLNDAIGKRGLGRRVTLRENVPHRDVRALMRSCAVGVVPLSARCGPEKRQFASPLKLAEWLASGAAVVATTVPSIATLIRDGVEARLVAPDDARALAAAVGELLGDETLRGRLARGGLAYARRRSYAARAAAMIEFFEGLEEAIEN